MSKRTLHCLAELRIRGMTCRSCELFLERRLKAIHGIVDADVDYSTGIARLTADAGRLPSEETIATVVRDAGYSIGGEPNTIAAGASRKWLEIGSALIVVLAAGKMLAAFDLVSLAPSVSSALTLGGVFLIGLVAGTSSCLAVTGGLLLAMAAKYHTSSRTETHWEALRPLLHFNIGRLVSYTILGGVTGLAGRAITLTPSVTGYMNIVIAAVMLFLALMILEIVPRGSCPIRPPKRFSRWIAGLSESRNPAAPFALGALTFFLPCGFTQSLQLASLSSGGFLPGALIMGVFALGTLPSLISLSLVSSAASGVCSRLFLRFSGAAVLLLALFNLRSGLALAGVNFSRILPPATLQGSLLVPEVRNGVQEITTRVTPWSYEPQQLAVKAGIPVRWTVDGTQAGSNCTSMLSVPSLNVFEPIAGRVKTYDFTPSAPGTIAFSCSMGMVRGAIAVL